MYHSNRTRLHITLAFLFILVANPLAAAEQQDPWYFGLGVGKMQADGYGDHYKRDKDNLPFYSEDSSGGGHIFIGYDLANFSVELSHGVFSNLKADFATHTEYIKVKYYSLTAMKDWQLGQSGRFWGYGRGGIYRWEVSQRFDLAAGAGEFENKETGISPMLGIGLGYGTQGDLGVRLELDYLFDAGDNTNVPQSDIQFTSISFVVWF